MKPEHASRAQLVDQLRELKLTCESLIRIVENKQYIKSNRIASLRKKRHDLTLDYKQAIRDIDQEIIVTRHSQDYPRSLPSGPSDEPRRGDQDTQHHPV